MIKGTLCVVCSVRHTIQRDPITYNDDITAQFGAKPSFWKVPLEQG